MTVFDRLSGGVRATQAGKSFLRGSRAILEQLDMLIGTARGTGRGEFGRIGIGFYTSLSAGISAPLSSNSESEARMCKSR